jgi:hypothetical protein
MLKNKLTLEERRHPGERGSGEPRAPENVSEGRQEEEEATVRRAPLEYG